MSYLSHVIETFELLKGKEGVKLQCFGFICDNCDLLKNDKIKTNLIKTYGQRFAVLEILM